MRPRILMVLHLPPPIHGAAVMGKYLIESRLINESFDVDHINLSTSTDLAQVGKTAIGKFVASTKVLFRVFAALLTKRYDLCYVTLTSSSAGFYKDLLVVCLLKLFRTRLVYHFHNKGISERQSRWFDDLLYRFAFRGTKTILLSPLLYSDIKKYVRSENVFICPNGIPFTDVLTNGNKTQKRTCKLLFLSNMAVQKGVITLLNACQYLKDKQVAFECHFVGAWAGMSSDEFNKLVAERQLGSHVIAHGAKFDLDKHSFFAESDIFVLPTLNECFSLVLLEAMSFGLPVVSTLEGGIPDIVVNEQTGFVIEKENSVELAHKLEVLISQPELRTAYGNEGKKRFIKNFTIDRFETNMAKILRSSVYRNA